MGQVIRIDEARIRDHLGEMVRGRVEEALNAMLTGFVVLTDMPAARAAKTCGRGTINGRWTPGLARSA